MKNRHKILCVTALSSLFVINGTVHANTNNLKLTGIYNERNVARTIKNINDKAAFVNATETLTTNLETYATSVHDELYTRAETEVETKKTIMSAVETKEEVERKIAEEQARLEAERIAKEKAASGIPYFGADGLLAMNGTARADQVLYLLHKIPGHANGSWAHAEWGIDAMIDELTVEEATWVIHRAEGAGFGQTGDGYAGYDTPASHQAFLNNQVDNRFGGNVKNLLKAWGTYHYPGY